MDSKKKFSLKSIIQKSSSNHGLSGQASSGDRLQHQNTGQTWDQVLSAWRATDTSLETYAREKSSRQSTADPTTADTETDAAILESIDAKYFRAVGAEPQTEDELAFDGLPAVLSLDWLSERTRRLRRQLSVVSTRVSELILKNECKYESELERVTRLQASLSDAIKVCTTGRRSLDRCRGDFTGRALAIVASHRRREVLRGLLKSVQTIKTLQETDVRLRELLEEDEDYTGAIRLYVECHRVVQSMRHFQCIRELNAKLQDTLDVTEEQIDVALSRMCLSFNRQLYVRLMKAYELLGKTQTAMDQLLMHFASAVHNKAFAIVLGYVELFAETTGADNYHKRQYNELCRCLSTDSFPACLTDLCKALFDIMGNYYRILSFHRQHREDREDRESTEDGSRPSARSEATGADNETHDTTAGLDSEFVIEKLEHGLGRVWTDVQQKVRSLIQNHRLMDHNFDDFLRILAITETMVDIGEEFCGNRSHELQTSLHSQTINYFQNYHKSCMSELKEFLDSECWTVCPVRDFSLVHLQEFQWLSTSLPSQRLSLSPNSSPNKRQKYYFSRRFLEPTDRSKGSTPFDVDDDVVPASDGKASDVNTGAEDKAMGRKVSNGECEGTGGSGEGCGDSDEPIMTNTTLNTLRLFGKYMQMMSILRPIAVDAMLCLFQVFDYYLNSVYQLFAKEMVSLSDTSLSNDMKAQIKRIGDHLMVDERAVVESGVDPSVVNSSHNHNNKYFPPILSTVVDMSSAEGLYGLAERVVAVESLVVLSTQFQSLKPYVEELIPQEKRHILQQYFNQVVSIASDLRQPVYMWVTVRCIPYESVVAAMATTQWNIRDILSLHNPYVDQLLRELQIFSMRLNGVFASRLNARVVPQEVYRCLWEHVLRLSSRTFIEGFSEAKRCTHEGRALMQLDFQQFVSKVETMTTIRPIPERQLVDEYIKAYYLTEGALIEWIKARKEYNQKQIHGLVHCMTNDNKKMRARIVAQIGPNA